MQVFLEIRDFELIINVQIFFVYGICEISQLYIGSASQIVQKLLPELKSQGELIF